MSETSLETRLSLYRTMLRARGFEQRASDLFLQNLVKGTNHLAMGQEAVAAAFGVAMEKGDYTYCTYRGHTHTLVRGADMTALFGELMGRDCGILSGKGGSMHLTSVEHGAMAHTPSSVPSFVSPMVVPGRASTKERVKSLSCSLVTAPLTSVLSTKR